MADVESELLEMTRDPQPEKEADERPKGERVRGADGKFTSEPEPPKETEKPGTEPVSGKETTEKVEDKPKPGTFAALRKAHEELQKKRDTEWHPKIQKLESQVKSYEQKIRDLETNSPALQPMQDKLSAIEKENNALKEEIRYVNYKKHPEFVDKYEKPYNEAWSKAVSEVTQLSMEMEDGTVRKATASDFLALANAPLDQLDDLAAKWFPKSSARVIRHVEKVRDLADQQEKALDDAKKNAGTRESEMVKQAQQRDATITQVYKQTNDELVKKYPKWFAPEEGDAEGNTALEKGYEYADSVFGGNGTLAPEQKAKRLAVIRAKAASYDRLARRLKARETRIAELENSLAEYEKSEPTTQETAVPGTVAAGNFFETIEQEIRALAK
jgi:predicted  nucleic acid-binding Zn-ribbon protein